MILLDTNVLSALMLRVPDPSVVSWLDKQPTESIWTTTVTLFEIEYGIALLDDAARKDHLLQAFEAALGDDLSGQILDLDRPSAVETAKLLATRRRVGRVLEVRDAMIAGIAISRRATLATRNVRHFVDTGVQIVNPWTEI